MKYLRLLFVCLIASILGYFAFQELHWIRNPWGAFTHESQLILFGLRALQGQVPYIDFQEIHGPLNILIYYLLELLTANSFYSARFLLAVFTILFPFLWYRLASFYLDGFWKIALATALATAWSPVLHFSPWPNWTANFFLLVGAVCSISPKRNWPAVLAGIFLCVCALARYNVGLIAIALFAVYFFTQKRKEFAAFLAGILIGGLAWIGIALTQGWLWACIKNAYEASLRVAFHEHLLPPFSLPTNQFIFAQQVVFVLFLVCVVWLVKAAVSRPKFLCLAGVALPIAFEMFPRMDIHHTIYAMSGVSFSIICLALHRGLKLLLLMPLVGILIYLYIPYSVVLRSHVDEPVKIDIQNTSYLVNSSHARQFQWIQAKVLELKDRGISTLILPGEWLAYVNLRLLPPVIKVDDVRPNSISSLESQKLKEGFSEGKIAVIVVWNSSYLLSDGLLPEAPARSVLEGKFGRLVPELWPAIKPFEAQRFQSVSLFYRKLAYLPVDKSQ